MTEFEKIFESDDLRKASEDYLDSINEQVNKDAQKRMKITGESLEEVATDISFIHHIHYLLGLVDEDSKYWMGDSIRALIIEF